MYCCIVPVDVSQCFHCSSPNFAVVDESRLSTLRTFFRFVVGLARRAYPGTSCWRKWLTFTVRETKTGSYLWPCTQQCASTIVWNMWLINSTEGTNVTIG